ncbi:MAG: hypothetical protein CMF80_06930 [Candidatus Marinimicrobia bacterium]|nr:hypothetical protein [Candidatus Neomarinimicrobiota bacterium]|tara:strand:+ start:976 stop:2109 length:1134 start_codon:yes stop_codon:yes gene_type:complete
MPSFKPKTNKKINVKEKDTITLDTKHQEITEKFKVENEVDIPKLKKKIRFLNKKYTENNLSLEHKLDIKDEIIRIKNQIKDIKKNQKQYYLKNSTYIFNYFEDKKDIENGNTNTKILNSFFKIDDKNSKNTEELDRNSNLYNYLKNIDDSFISVNNFILNTDICKSCNKGELIPVDHEGIIVCNNIKCGKQFPYLIENEKPSYKEPPKEVCFYAYKRINHFREILAQFQAKESTQIPENVIQDIILQMKKERINLEALNNKRAKDILKKLGYSKYYEHIPFIKEKLGIRPPIMSPELEDKLCNLFMEIQAPYAKYCPDGRVNFLNYYYTISKLCELLDERDFLPYFPVLKDREKRIEQDDIWKKICKELNWKFIPTL